MLSKAVKQDGKENRTALSHNQKLLADLARTISEIQRGGCSNNEIVSKLSAIQDDAKAFAKHLSHRLPPKYYNEIRTRDSTAAERVLNLPELLELILLPAGVREIMAMEQVNKSIRDTIKAAPRLQMALYLKPETSPENAPEEKPDVDRRILRTFLSDFGEAKEDRYRSHFARVRRFPGFEVTLRQNEVEATFRKGSGDGGMPKIGDRSMKMLLCQPPVKSLSVIALGETCGMIKCSKNKQGEITSETGLTVADLYERAKQMSPLSSSANAALASVAAPHHVRL